MVRVLRARQVGGKGREQGHDWPYCIVWSAAVVSFIFLFDVSIITRHASTHPSGTRSARCPHLDFYFFLRASAE
jgi:hypothetical protein